MASLLGHIINCVFLSVSPSVIGVRSKNTEDKNKVGLVLAVPNTLSSNDYNVDASYYITGSLF